MPTVQPDRILMPYTPSQYQPRFIGGHTQTLYAWARTRHFPRLPAPVERYFDVAADARVLAHCHWQDTPADHPTIIVLHGLEGSSAAHYMRGIADKAWFHDFIERQVIKRNIMTGEEFTEPANRPYFCSPSTETYWSM